MQLAVDEGSSIAADQLVKAVSIPLTAPSSGISCRRQANSCQLCRPDTTGQCHDVLIVFFFLQQNIRHYHQCLLRDEGIAHESTNRAVLASPLSPGTLVLDVPLLVLDLPLSPSPSPFPNPVLIELHHIYPLLSHISASFPSSFALRRVQLTHLSLTYHIPRVHLSAQTSNTQFHIYTSIYSSNVTMSLTSVLDYLISHFEDVLDR